VDHRFLDRFFFLVVLRLRRQVLRLATVLSDLELLEEEELSSDEEGSELS
jgi:hypothetical protein